MGEGLGKGRYNMTLDNPTKLTEFAIKQIN